MLAQAFVTSTITTVLTAFTSFGLAAVSAWFATERWIFHRHRGTKWLGDVLTELNERFLDLPGMVLFRGVHRMSKKVARTTKSSLSRASTLTLNMLSGNGQTASPDENEQGNDVISINTLDMASPTSPQHPSAYRPSFSLDAKASASPEGDKKDGNSDSKSGSPSLTAKARFSNAVRSVMTLQSTSGTSGPLSPLSPTRKRTASTNVPTTEHTRGRSFDNNVTAIPGSRVAYLVPRLQSLEPTQDLAAHSALVRHLQFSPNGNFLATSRCVLLV
jgi:WD repeat-containing protein 26